MPKLKGSVSVEYIAYTVGVVLAFIAAISFSNGAIKEMIIKARGQQEIAVNERITNSNTSYYSDIVFEDGKILLSPFKTVTNKANACITTNFHDLSATGSGVVHGALDIAPSWKCVNVLNLKKPQTYPINAILDGIITYIEESRPTNPAGVNCTADNGSVCFGSIGNEVRIESTNMYDIKGIPHTIEVIYYHIDINSATKYGWHVGDQVTAGDLIADEGNNGLSTGYHLHLVVKIDGEKVDPAQYINWKS